MISENIISAWITQHPRICWDVCPPISLLVQSHISMMIDLHRIWSQDCPNWTTWNYHSGSLFMNNSRTNSQPHQRKVHFLILLLTDLKNIFNTWIHILIFIYLLLYHRNNFNHSFMTKDIAQMEGMQQHCYLWIFLGKSQMVSSRTHRNIEV